MLTTTVAPPVTSPTPSYYPVQTSAAPYPVQTSAAPYFPTKPATYQTLPSINHIKENSGL